MHPPDDRTGEHFLISKLHGTFGRSQLSPLLPGGQSKQTVPKEEETKLIITGLLQNGKCFLVVSQSVYLATTYASKSLALFIPWARETPHKPLSPADAIKR